jgi:hypothetical protein
MRYYRAAFITVGFFLVISISYTFRMNKELKILQKWKKHVLDDDWSDQENEDLQGLSNSSTEKIAENQDKNKVKTE